MDIPEKYFNVHVKPNWQEFNDVESSAASSLALEVLERRAMNAAVSANQMRDYMFITYDNDADRHKILGATNKKKYSAEIIKLCPSFELMEDVANAHKHLKLDRDRTNTDLTSAGELEAIRAVEPVQISKTTVIPISADKNLVHTVRRPGFIVKNKMWIDLSGTLIDFGPELKNVIDFWETELKRV